MMDRLIPTCSASCLILPGRDRRIELGRRRENMKAFLLRRIVDSSLARGEWLTFLDHDDVLEPDALFQIVKFLQTHPDVDLIYTDEDKLGGERFRSATVQTGLVARFLSLLQLRWSFDCGAPRSCSESRRIPFALR